MSRLFHKAYSNSITYKPGYGGSVCSIECQKKYKEEIKKIRIFLEEYQETYQTTGEILEIPCSLRKYMKYISKIFRIEQDNIENILKFITRKYFPYKNKEENNMPSSKEQSFPTPRKTTGKKQRRKNKKKTLVMLNRDERHSLHRISTKDKLETLLG